MLGVYNYTVILTYIGMISGFTGITLVVQGDIHKALICLIVSGICDMFDGKIASTRKRTACEKRYGVQIDSLSDLICFGVLPAVMVSSICRNSIAGYCTCSLYVLSSLIRLAWFNVDEEERQSNCSGQRQYYLGLPVTLAAVFVPLAFWTLEYFGLPYSRLLPAVLAVLSIAFLTPFKIRKPSLSRLGIAICGGAGVLLLIMSGMDV